MDEQRLLFGSLTRCEIETLRLTCAGKSVKEIATDRGVSGKTVDTRRGRIFTKLNVHSATEATTFSYRNGLLE